ncbi:MAG: hypothetical protein AAGH53_04085 [Pseudomonadota bacterium]
MNIAKTILVAAAACISFIAIADSVEAKRHHHNHRHHHHWNDWDNRRDARRAGIIAGAAAAGIARAAANDNARDHYRECMDYYGFNRRYERYCREEYYRDQRHGRRAARRAGVVVGLGVREIVRD